MKDAEFSIKTCPKCLHDLQVQSEICPHCGIVFEKYLKYHPDPAHQQDVDLPIVTIIIEDEAKPLTRWLFYETPQSTLAYLGRSIVFVGLVLWSWLLISSSIESNAVGNSFLHLINLPFHEAAPTILSPFVQFVHKIRSILPVLQIATIM